MAETQSRVDCGPKPACEKQARGCPCCGYGYPKRASLITDRYGWKWSLHVCGHCGVEYQARPMTDAARREFYGSGRYRQLCALVTGQPWDDPEYLKREQFAYASNWLRNGFGHECEPGMWRVQSPFRGSVLDFGGSTGVVGQYLTEGLATLTVADYGDGATTTPEQALSVPNGTYDAILCCQTLDHLAEPLATLQQFLRVAKPSAKLFVDVVKKPHTAYKIDHDVYFPTATSFLGLIERSGWSVLWLDGETNPTHWSVLAEKP